MSELRNGNLILSQEASKKLIRNLMYPDQEAWEKKERFLETFKEATIDIGSDGTITWDIPSLNIPSKEEIMYLHNDKVFKNSVMCQKSVISISYNETKNFDKNILYKKKNRKKYSKKATCQYSNTAFVDIKTIA